MSEQQWYMAKHGHQIGPMSEVEVTSNIHNGSADGTTLVFTAGMSNWTPLADVPQLAAHLSAGHTAAPPTLPGRTAHEIGLHYRRQRDAVCGSRARPGRERHRRGGRP